MAGGKREVGERERAGDREGDTWEFKGGLLREVLGTESGVAEGVVAVEETEPSWLALLYLCACKSVCVCVYVCVCQCVCVCVRECVCV